MAGYATPSTYEQQNDDSMDRLFNKVHSLRQVTINIHSDAEQQRSLLDDTSSAMDQFGANLRKTSQKLTNEVVRYSRSNKMTVSVIGGIVFIWAVWYFFL